MPWTVDNPPRPAKNWSESEKKKCVTAANAVLREGGKEQDAIFACIRAAGKTKNPGGKKAFDTTIRNVLESKIHQSFTVAADELFSRGYMTREQRIELSGLIGDVLESFGDSLDNDLGNFMVNQEDVTAVADKEQGEMADDRESCGEEIVKESSIIDRIANAIADFSKTEIRSAYAKLKKEPPDSTKEFKPSAYIFKADDGLYYGVGIVSNNRLDRHEQIIVGDALRSVVKAIDDGSYRAVMGYSRPEIWLWHLPAPIGDSLNETYDERGFLITAWKQRDDEFSTKAHEVLEKIQDTLGMSHSFPAMLTTFDRDNPNHITGLFPREFTLLPLVKAANWLTGTAAIMYKDLEGFMNIPDHKREWFASNFGDEFVAELDQRLSLLEQAADAARLPQKELDMPEKDEGQEAVEEEVTEAAETEETAETEVEGAAETEVETEETTETEQTEQTGMTPTEFTIPKEALDEIVLGVKQPFDLLLKEVQTMNTAVAGLITRVENLEKDEGEKLAKKAADTPQASLGTLIARSVIGNPAAQVDYGKERELYGGPDENKGVDDVEPLGIGYLDEMRSQQRGKKRVIPGSAFNQQ